MSKCYVSITFDDGREDTYRNAYKILKKHNLSSTIYVISGYVDGSYKHKLASSSGPVSISNLAEMKKNGVEISLHGDMHITDYDDLDVCQKKMKSWKLIDKEYGFSMPHSNEEKLSDNRLNAKLKKDLEYVRVGKSKKCLKIINKFYYFMYIVTKIRLFYWLYNRNNIIDNNNIDWYHLISIPVKNFDKAKSLSYLIDKSLNKNQWVIFMFHSVLNNTDKEYGNSKWEYDYNEFDKFCEYLENLSKKKKIKVLSVLEVKKEMIKNV